MIPVSNATKLKDVGDGSNKPVSIAVVDSTGAAMIPSAATWSLYDQDGDVVNSRTAVSISGPGSTFTVPVLAADNVYNATVERGICRRFLKVDITYTNSYVTGGHLIDWWQWDIKKFP